MCGIIGFVNLDQQQPASERIARAMNQAIVHRGPDDEGFYFNGNVALGMRRLSIIDLAGGHQPISNEDGSVWVVFNGEIYNYRELRELLLARGHQLKTNSDTETIVHLYEDYGDELVQHLNGMFGFALWDERRRRLLIARDRMGEKPLYFAQTGESFVFASELKALVEHPSVQRRVNLSALRKYLQYEFVPSPHTMLEGVQKLPPAHRLIFENGRWRTERYWQLSYGGERLKLNEEEAAEEVRRRLREAVRMRLVADVPLGVLLSGGIDSSAMAQLACEAAGGRVKTFSIAFEEKSFDESSYARKVAEQLGTEHYEKRFTEREMLDIVPEIPRLLDEPLGDGSLIPTFLLSKFTRERVTVALGGDGGDELFAGYPTYSAHRVAGLYQMLPQFVRSVLIEPAVAALPVSTDNLSFDFKAKRFVRGATHAAGTRHTVWMGSYDAAQQRELLRPEIIAACPDEEVFDEVLPYDRANGNGNLIERMMKLDATHYLSECVLFKVDRASMAASLETRAPFLDHTFVEFVLKLPVEMKLKGFTGKYILKKAMRGHLPDDVIDRPKKGFGMPVAKWVKGELRDFVRDTFSPERLNRRGLFNAGYVQRLLDEHESGIADHRKLIWTLLMFEMWPLAA
ncbi:MAG TPA: asparagine synthase (glutamine-hydrolyzing) [Blastocatellia bacterium]|nr:asparagine synthase (glutamine-hydrolyzing) [Blastocatellia bacterium]HMV81995.1 asparagine synthase (glutamine-hydrolyzing) [Blastocatellia bacterium]HMX24896.1 asparagine synthase (glutamine-hydrolyzing) [Blastocatellia bacterium]HMY70965.1 asparagine synthase (glutamine-hydrolyzing) [Blastocatellia bacterium]HMZ20428.1 asparagine synthase (glutamine-hydrolyzing) [Blastocatellia bacterium]